MPLFDESRERLATGMEIWEAYLYSRPTDLPVYETGLAWFSWSDR